MKTKILIIFLLVSIKAIGQDGITFSVETLKKPAVLLPLEACTDVYQNLILSDVDMYKSKDDSIIFPYNIIARSKTPDSLVSFGYHSFFDGMYQAYADHRPFVLSPDMIWLLICQGFARHVNANAEKLRPYFVNFEGKLTLLVSTNEITLDNPSSPWEKVFPEFAKQIGAYTGKDLMEVLSSNFSTTTAVEKVASEITIMEAMKPYFEFIVYMAACGIPDITLKGTTADWQKVLNKTKCLEKYDLKWWTKELEPILKEFIKASKGKIDKNFWRNMFKYHTKKQYGAPRIVDGWIVKFFPYDKEGKRNNLKQLQEDNDLPEEIVKVDLIYMEMINGAAVNTPLELWAGFVGLEQNSETFALTPKIGWMIRKKDIDNTGLKQKLFEDNNSFGITMRVKEIPEAILEMKEIKYLELDFTENIIIPDRLANVKIEFLKLFGTITNEEIQRIKKLFPNTKLFINNNLNMVE